MQMSRYTTAIGVIVAWQLINEYKKEKNKIRKKEKTEIVDQRCWAEKQMIVRQHVLPIDRMQGLIPNSNQTSNKDNLVPEW